MSQYLTIFIMSEKQNRTTVMLIDNFPAFIRIISPATLGEFIAARDGKFRVSDYFLSKH